MAKPTRVRVRCVPSDPDVEEELWVVPLPEGDELTVGGLLDKVRERVSCVSVEDVQVLELETGARLFGDDLARDVVQPGEVLIASAGGRQEAPPTDGVQHGPSGAAAAAPLDDTAEASCPAGGGAEFAALGGESVQRWSTQLSAKKHLEWPPLLLACYTGDADAVERLLDSGHCDVNAYAGSGGGRHRTPLYYAVLFDYVRIVQLLLGHPDIDPHREIRTGGGKATTAVLAALQKGPKSEVLQEFVAAGWASPRDATSRTAPPPPDTPDAGGLCTKWPWSRGEARAESSPPPRRSRSPARRPAVRSRAGHVTPPWREQPDRDPPIRGIRSSATRAATCSIDEDGGDEAPGAEFTREECFQSTLADLLGQLEEQVGEKLSSYMREQLTDLFTPALSADTTDADMVDDMERIAGQLSQSMNDF